MANSVVRNEIGIKQKQLPIFIGTFYDVFIMASPVMSPISYLMVSSTAYAVTREWLLVWFPWLEYWVFMVFLVGAYLIAMFCVYKFLYASYFAHRNRQEYKHENPLRGDIAAVKADIEKIKRALNIE